MRVIDKLTTSPFGVDGAAEAPIAAKRAAAMTVEKILLKNIVFVEFFDKERLRRLCRLRTERLVG